MEDQFSPSWVSSRQQTLPPAIRTVYKLSSILSGDKILMQTELARMNEVKKIFPSISKKNKITSKELDTITVNNFIGSKREADTFQSSMKVTLICGQMFGLNPVLGITEKDATKLRFSYISWRFALTAVSFVLQFTNVIFTLKAMFENGMNFDTATRLIYYSSCCLILVLLARIAVRWPELSRNVAKDERFEPCKDKYLTKRCNIACILVLTMALTEHILSSVAALAGSMDCSPEEPVFKGFVMAAFYWIFTNIPYNNFLGVLAVFVNLQAAFNWNFIDLFIIIMSFYLTSRLEQINRRIYAVRGKHLPNTFWKTAREDYCRVTHLVRLVDDVIGPLVFVSFANNLYFVCDQLFHTLEDGIKGAPFCNAAHSNGLFGGYEHAVYFVFSFVLLVSRALAVSIYAAKVNSAAKSPATVLYDVPSSTFTVEVERFLDQVTGDNVALSGLQFFSVTRGLVLKVAGTIVTYELVLVQFNSASSPAPTSPTPNMITPTNASGIPTA